MSTIVPPARPLGAATPATAPKSLWELVRESGLQTVVLATSKNPNARVTLMLVASDDGRPVLAAKVPMTDIAAHTVRAEAAVLSEIQARVTPELGRTIPRVVELAMFEGRPALVATAVAGTPLTTAYIGRGHLSSRLRVAGDLRAVGGWLAGLQQSSTGALARVDVDPRTDELLARRFASEPGIGEDRQRLARIRERLAGESVPRTIVHGDFWFGNLLVEEGRVTGVVDWEAAAVAGDPVRDLVRFALFYAFYLDRRARPGRAVDGHPGLRADHAGAGVEYALTGEGWFHDAVRGFLQEGLARLGASPGAWLDVALAGVAEVAATTDDPAFAHLHLQLFRRLLAASDGSGS